MKKLIAIAAVALVLLAGYVVAGPYLVVHAITGAIEERDAPALAKHVDFPALRRNLGAQISTALLLLLFWPRFGRSKSRR